LAAVAIMATVTFSYVGSMEGPRESAAREDRETPSRWELTGEVVLEHRPVRDLTGFIYRDRETDIEYVLLGNGQGVTRLYRKGE
jgi:hypothetical protein